MKTHLAVVSGCPLGSSRPTQCRGSRAEVEGLAGSFEMGAGFALVRSLLYFVSLKCRMAACLTKISSLLFCSKEKVAPQG